MMLHCKHLNCVWSLSVLFKQNTISTLFPVIHVQNNLYVENPLLLSSMDNDRWNSMQQLWRLIVPPYVVWGQVKGQVSVGTEPIKKAHSGIWAATENPLRLINSYTPGSLLIPSYFDKCQGGTLFTSTCHLMSFVTQNEVKYCITWSWSKSTLHKQSQWHK